jgi:hypothetical protein
VRVVGAGAECGWGAQRRRQIRVDLQICAERCEEGCGGSLATLFGQIGNVVEAQWLGAVLSARHTSTREPRNHVRTCACSKSRKRRDGGDGGNCLFQARVVVDDDGVAERVSLGAGGGTGRDCEVGGGELAAHGVFLL